MAICKIIKESFNLATEVWEILSEELVSGSRKKIETEVTKLNNPWINVVREEFVRRIAYVEKNISNQTIHSSTSHDILRNDKASLKKFDANPYQYDAAGYPYVTMRFRIEEAKVRKI